MRRNRSTVGLDQLGPTQSHMVGSGLDEARFYFAHKPHSRHLSFGHRAHLSTVARKIKITLPRLSCLEKPFEAD